MARKPKTTVRDMVIESELNSFEKVSRNGSGSSRTNVLPDSVATYMELLGGYPSLSPLNRRFLGAFSICGILSKAALAVGCTTNQHYAWMKSNQQYREAFGEAVRISNDYLEGLALELASGMREKPVVSMGKIVTYEPIYDSKLLSQLLRARMPEKYGTKVDITSNGHSIVKVIDQETYDGI